MLGRVLATIVALVCLAACGGPRSESGAIGVPECDEYEARLATCAARQPHLNPMSDAARVQRDVWKQMAKADRQTVKANCHMALQALSNPQVCP